MKKIVILRLGHRLVRDARVTTHCALVSRALGAEKIILAGEEDPYFEKEIKSISEQWGGSFETEFTDSWKKTLNEYKQNGFTSIHLTMYGEPLQEVIKKVKEKSKFIILIGSQKVPMEVYHEADFNASVTSQPHSEIAALAVTLHELFEGKELNKKFSNAKIKISPDPRGKKVISNKSFSDKNLK